MLAIISKAVGYDQVSKDMILRINEYTLPIITDSFNFSLTAGGFPALWSKVFVLYFPNFKILVLLRPMSILPFLYKVLKAVIITKLLSYS